MEMECNSIESAMEVRRLIYCLMASLYLCYISNVPLKSILIRQYYVLLYGVTNVSWIKHRQGISYQDGHYSESIKFEYLSVANNMPQQNNEYRHIKKDCIDIPSVSHVYIFYLLKIKISEIWYEDKNVEWICSFDFHFGQ